MSEEKAIKIVERKKGSVMEYETVHETDRIRFRTDKGRFEISVNTLGEIDILCISNMRDFYSDRIMVYPASSNKISIDFVKHDFGQSEEL